MVPRGYWSSLSKDLGEQKRVIDWLSVQLSIKSLEDWYRVSVSQLNKKIAIENISFLSHLLRTVYPQHEWDFDRLRKIGTIVKASQRELVIAVQELFPNHRTYYLCIADNVCTDVLEEASIKSIQLDVYIPSLHLAMEYQGRQHYEAIYWVSDLEALKQRDIEKRQVCEEVKVWGR